MDSPAIKKILEEYGQILLDREKANGRLLYDSIKPRITSLSVRGKIPPRLKHYIAENNRKKALEFDIKSYGRCFVKMDKTNYLKAMRLKWCYIAFKEWFERCPTQENRKRMFKFFNYLPTVAAIILNENDEVLLGTKSQKVTGTTKNVISIPAGVMEIGENFENAILREIKEETSVNVKLDTDGFIIANSEVPSFTFAKIARITSGTPTNLSGEFESLFFVPIDLLSAYHLSERAGGLTRYLKNEVSEINFSKTAELVLKDFLKEQPIRKLRN